MPPADQLGIDHVVVLQLENVSFDKLLGWMGPATNWTGPRTAPRGAVNVVRHEGRVIPVPFKIGAASLVGGKSPHTPVPMHEQLWPVGQPACGGYAQRYFEEYVKNEHALPDWSEDEVARRVGPAMAAYARDQVPVTAFLAENFTVCDHWFASIAASTFPNRHHLHLGRSPTGPRHLPTAKKWPTILDLVGNGSWRVYNDGAAMILAEPSVAAGVLEGAGNRLRPFSQFAADAAAGDLPRLTVIEPRHYHDRRNGVELSRTNNHHYAHIHRGERLLAEIYAALVASGRFDRTVWIVNYDEGGGWYDSVPPGGAVHPETGVVGTSPPAGPGREDHYGARVPALIISPRVGQGVHRAVCDHSSVGAFIAWLFGTNAGLLGARAARAENFSTIVRPDAVAVPGAVPVVPPEPAEGDHQGMTNTERFMVGVVIKVISALSKGQPPPNVTSEADVPATLDPDGSRAEAVMAALSEGKGLDSALG